MKCPICGNEMICGMLIIGDSGFLAVPEWYPEEEAKKKGMASLQRTGGIRVGFPKDYRTISRENHYEAHRCDYCKKIIGCFDQMYE